MSEERIIRWISILTLIAGIFTWTFGVPHRAMISPGVQRIDKVSNGRSILTIPILVQQKGAPLLRIKSTSCIFAMSVNGMPETNPALPFCDSFKGRVFTTKHLEDAGEFLLQLEISNDPFQQTTVQAELPPWRIFTATLLLLTSFIFGLLTCNRFVNLSLSTTGPTIRMLYESIRGGVGIILVLWIINFFKHGSPSTTTLVVTCLLSLYLFRLTRWKDCTRDLIPIPEVKKQCAARYMVCAFGIAAFILVCTISIIRHWDLRSLAYDLGIQENVLWNTLNGNPFLSSVMDGIPYLGNHTVVAYVLLLPIYFIFQSTETLLILQSGVVCSTILPFFLIGRRLLKNEVLAAILGICFLIHPGILGASCNDFHELSLAPPALIWISYCALFEKKLALACLTLVASCIKEDMSLNLLLLGGGLFVMNIRAKGIYLMVCGALSYIAWQKIVIPNFAGFDSSYVWYLSKTIGNTDSPLSVLYLLLESPFTMIVPLFDEERMKFLLQTIGAYAFLPWCSLFGIIVTSYGNALVLLSGHWPLYTLGYHYVFPWITLMHLATLFFISSLMTKRVQTLLLSVIVFSHSWIFINYGPLYPREFFAVGPSKQKDPFLYTTESRVREEVSILSKIIPADASVLTEEHLVPHFSRRKRILSLNRAPKELIETFDYCIAEKKGHTSSCSDFGCSGKDISRKDSTLLVCSRA